MLIYLFCTKLFCIRNETQRSLYKNCTLNHSDKHPRRNMMGVSWYRQHGNRNWKRVDMGIHIGWIISLSWADVQWKRKKKKWRNTSKLKQNVFYLLCLLLVSYPMYCLCTYSMIGFWGGLKINKISCANIWNVHDFCFLCRSATQFPLL